MSAPNRSPSPSRDSCPAPAAERGVALVLTLIFSILLYILVAELVVSSRMVRSTGENDALLARMRNLMVYQLGDVEQGLVDDLAGQMDQGGGSGGLGSALGGAAPGGAGGGEEAAPEEDPSTKCDSSRDSWFQPVGNADEDITTYVWVEDENRKFNLLSLWSYDEEFAEFSRDRLVRLLDSLREDTEFDLSTGDAERIAMEIKDWAKRPDLDAIPRPKLKSDDEKRRDITLPMHLDELMLLPSIKEDLFYDKVLDGKVYLGLESVLTIWTSLVTDPGDPEKVARQQAKQAINESAQSGGSGQGNGGQGSGGQGSGSTPSAGTGKQGGGLASPAENEPPPQPEGLGIHVNVNTATRPVLRALFPPDKIPDRVIDAIIRYRNEVDEEEQAKLEEEGQSTDVTDFGDLQLGSDQKYKFFETVDDLEKVEDFANLPDPQVKADFQAALTTKSDVFTIHLASLYKRNEENRVYVLRRARSVVLRVDDNGTGAIVPLVPFEERTGLRVQPVDLQEERAAERSLIYANMDQFSQEERAWNPFLIDFYLPKHMRDEFYQPR
ncbi:MAG: general secretion pathway protein GspK [Planctomycetes bacterium]|nr:general secretion pathway protein GspK [Planctomycetota bacterium]MCB9885998.1 general secretion pathway protein GspK [Planctomycetota bacterium]